MGRVAIIITLTCFIYSLPSLSRAQTPELLYSTYLGGSQYDRSYGIYVDSAQCAYVTGYTESADFPFFAGYQASFSGGTEDAFITKFSSSGSSLFYSTYLGGSSQDEGYKLKVDSETCAYITGRTQSPDFPTLNAYQTSNAGGSGNWDAFITKLSSSGSALIYSTYLGGTSSDAAWGGNITIDTGSCAYVTGDTTSSNFPIHEAYQISLDGGREAYLAKLSSSGSSLIYSTYFGGSSLEAAEEISIDEEQCVYISGRTQSYDLPTLNPYQSSFSSLSQLDPDAFLTKFSSTGSTLVYSTYLGGADDDESCGVAVDQNFCAFVTGITSSPNFPTVNPYQAYLNGIEEDVFITKFSSTGSSLLYATYLGGYDSEYESAVAVDNKGIVHAAGHTTSLDFPVINPYQASRVGRYDGFITIISSSGSSLLYSTYFGGGGIDMTQDLALDSSFSTYVAGYTSSPNFPTQNAYQTSLNGVRDVFISKLRFLTTTPTPSTTPYLPTPSTTPSPSSTPTAFPTATPTPSAIPPTPSPTATFIPTATPTPALSRLPILDSGDYNGDGTSDIAVFRGSTGMWSVRGITRVYYGSASDLPISGDYNGDGTTDIGIFRPGSGLWGARGVTRLYYGSASDNPVPGDYDGDGSCDIGIYRTSSGLWAVIGVTRAYFGGVEDIAVPGDYDGDGAKDIAVFRRSSGMWAVQGLSRVYYGSSSDTVVPGDYNGDGTWEAGIFRSLSGMWGIRGVTRTYYGGSSDQAVPADYGGDSSDDIGIFRPGSGLWGIRNISRAYFGNSGDIPVTR